MTPTTTSIELTTEGFACRPELSAYAEAKAQRLLRHTHPRIELVRLHLRREAPHNGPAHFSLRGSVAGDRFVAHAQGDSPESALLAGIEKLERAVNADAGARKHRQHHPHAVELPVDLPKVSGDA